MTQLLEKAIAEAKNSLPEVQDAIANLILAELRDEQEWQQRFEKTRDDQWDTMAEAVMKEIASGDTEQLDELLMRTLGARSELIPHPISVQSSLPGLEDRRCNSGISTMNAITQRYL